MSTLTRKQLHKVVSENDYIAARWSDGDLTGINCKITRRIKTTMDDTPTRIVSYFPISFQHYITIKIPYKNC